MSIGESRVPSCAAVEVDQVCEIPRETDGLELPSAVDHQNCFSDQTGCEESAHLPRSFPDCPNSNRQNTIADDHDGNTIEHYDPERVLASTSRNPREHHDGSTSLSRDSPVAIDEPGNLQEGPFLGPDETTFGRERC